jgi:hypothetical membrane protein
MNYSAHAVRSARFAGMAIIAIFSLSILAALQFYPGSYSPYTNWISDLGNPAMNPSGAAFLNAGFVLEGILFIPFCLGLYRWHGHGRGGSLTFTMSAFSGFVAALSLVMIGIFPENYAASHTFWAVTFFGSMGFFLLLSSVHLLYCGESDSFAKRISYFGFLAFAADAAFALAFYDPTFEWGAAIASFVYVALLSYAMIRKS